MKLFFIFLLLAILMFSGIFLFTHYAVRTPTATPKFILDIEPFDYDSYIVEPNTEILSVHDQGRGIRVCVDANNLLVIRYDDCTTKEGAKIAYRILNMYLKMYVNHFDTER